MKLPIETTKSNFCNCRAVASGTRRATYDPCFSMAAEPADLPICPLAPGLDRGRSASRTSGSTGSDPLRTFTTPKLEKWEACRRTQRSHRGTQPTASPVRHVLRWWETAGWDRRSNLPQSQSGRASTPRRTSNRGLSRRSSRTSACQTLRGPRADLRHSGPAHRESRQTNRMERPCDVCSCRNCKARC